MSEPFRWELTQSANYPVWFPGFDEPAHIQFTPYTADELKDILKAVTIGFRQYKRNMETVPADITPYARLFDDHFVSIVNSTGTPEEQRQFCSAQGGAHGRALIVSKTLGGVERSETAAATGKFDIFSASSRRIDIEQDLAIEDGKDYRVVTVHMGHEYSSPTEEQFRRYRNARGNRHNNRKHLWVVTEDYNALEAAYDAVIRRVSGVTVNGNACETDNRDEWLPHIPLWHKLLVVDAIYGELAEKNG